MKELPTAAGELFKADNDLRYYYSMGIGVTLFAGGCTGCYGAYKRNEVKPCRLTVMSIPQNFDNLQRSNNTPFYLRSAPGEDKKLFYITNSEAIELTLTDEQFNSFDSAMSIQAFKINEFIHLNKTHIEQITVITSHKTAKIDYSLYAKEAGLAAFLWAGIKLYRAGLAEDKGTGIITGLLLSGAGILLGEAAYYGYSQIRP